MTMAQLCEPTAFCRDILSKIAGTAGKTWSIGKSTSIQVYRGRGVGGIRWKPTLIENKVTYSQFMVPCYDSDIPVTAAMRCNAAILLRNDFCLRMPKAQLALATAFHRDPVFLRFRNLLEIYYIQKWMEPFTAVTAAWIWMTCAPNNT